MATVGTLSCQLYLDGDTACVQRGECGKNHSRGNGGHPDIFNTFKPIYRRQSPFDPTPALLCIVSVSDNL